MNSRGGDTSIQFIAGRFKVFWSLESQYSVLPLQSWLGQNSYEKEITKTSEMKAGFYTVDFAFMEPWNSYSSCSDVTQELIN